MGPFIIVHHAKQGYVTVYLGDKALFDIEFSHSLFKKDTQEALDIVSTMIEDMNNHALGKCQEVA